MSPPPACTPHVPSLPVVELRQYTLHPGRRDELISLFDREFIDTQEDVGMTVLGQFRDEDDADRFVWLRGFAGMAERARALAAFYGGPVWQAHRDAANATMADSDNVLLLRPAFADRPMPIETWRRAGVPATGRALALVCPLTGAPEASFVSTFAQAMAGELSREDAAPAGCYVTESHPNTFPRLPVREGEQLLVWLARFERPEACDRFAAGLRASTRWFDAIDAPVAAPLVAAPQVLRLAPTAASRF